MPGFAPLAVFTLVSCAAPAPPTTPPETIAAGTVENSTEISPFSVDDGQGALDTAPGQVVFDEQIDVLVVGSGPAGMAAALAAREAGASVLMLERADTAATGVVYGSILLAVGTEEQRTEGVLDNPARAAEEWPQITEIPGDLPAVAAFLEGSGPTLAWLEGFGAVVVGLSQEHDGGDVPRMHTLQGTHTREVLLAAYDGELRTDAEVLGPLLRENRVVGVSWRDTTTGAIGTVRAGATVLATGGFLRNRDEVDAVRPDLVGRDLLYETNPYATGGGLPFLDAVGAGTQNTANIGIYLHSFQDPDYPDGESLRFGGSAAFLLVGEDGRRFADESLYFSLDLFDQVPEGSVYAVFPDETAADITASRPAFLWATPGVEESYALADLVTASDRITVAASEADLVEDLGVDADGFAASLDEANTAIDTGKIDRFGRDFRDFDRFEDGIWWAVELTPGLAKAYGGVATDLNTHVLTPDGTAIPGLYAAGEVAGMIPEGGAGKGFSGSASACYVFGRIAGERAAAEALGLAE